MGKWIKGNSPNKPGTYFITISRNGECYVPWEIYSYDGNTWSRESKYKQDLDKKRILAYMSAFVPKPFVSAYSPEYDKPTYFIRVDYGDGRVSEYGNGGWPRVGNFNIGYETPQKARAALIRRRNKDIEYGYENLTYCVVDNLGNVVKRKKKGRPKNE